MCAMQKIGILWGGDMSDVARFRDPFRKELRDLGHVEGGNIAIMDQYAEGNAGDFPRLARELVDSNVDVIVASGTPAAQAAATTTNAIPIVFAAVGDPSRVQGKNITGVRLPEPRLSGERLKFLKEAISGVSRVAVLRNATNPVHESYFAEMQVVANQLHISLQPLVALDALAADANALIVLPDPTSHSQRSKTMTFAIKKRLPAVYSQRSYVDEGGLMSYGPSYTEMFRQAASLVSKILNGTAPSQLPIVETSPERVINLNAAAQIGVTIPQSVFAGATVIN
jgi:putative ABC transport system substrate-binding protein